MKFGSEVFSRNIGHQISATIDGNNALLDLTISESLLQQGAAAVSRGVLAAVHNAAMQARDAQEKKLTELLGPLDSSELAGLLGK